MQSHQEFESYFLGATEVPVYARTYGNRDIMTIRAARKETPASIIAPGRRVLLILEDFDAIRGLFANHFEKRGYDVFSSATLRDALSIAREEDPKTVIIDHGLTGESAFEAIERLRSVLTNSFIVLVGGPDTFAIYDRAKNAGASKVLAKSFDLTNLDELVEEASSLTTTGKD